LTHLYIQVRGPSGVPRVVTAALNTGHGSGATFVVVPTVHGQKDCSRTVQINTLPVTAPSLRKFGGQKFTAAVYGRSNFAPAVCRQLGTKLLLVGGNRRVYRTPSSAMEPTLHCAKGAATLGCLGTADDQVVARLSGGTNLRRLDIAVFTTPQEAALKCGEGGVFVKRVIGLPGETVREDDHGFIWTRRPGSNTWAKLNEPYLSAPSRLADSAHFAQVWHVPKSEYFMMGDNRSESCDSRSWGSVPARLVIGPVVQIIRNGNVLTPAGIP